MEKVIVNRKIKRGRPQKFTELQKNEIVTQWNAGENMVSLAKRYNVSSMTIGNIIHDHM